MEQLIGREPTEEEKADFHILTEDDWLNNVQGGELILYLYPNGEYKFALVLNVDEDKDEPSLMVLAGRDGEFWQEALPYEAIFEQRLIMYGNPPLYNGKNMTRWITAHTKSHGGKRKSHRRKSHRRKSHRRKSHRRKSHRRKSRKN